MRQRMQRIAERTLVCVLLVCLPEGAARAADIEKELVEVVDRQLPEATVLLRRLVEVNSGTMNFAGVEEVGRMLLPEFEQLGFDARWLDGAAFGRAGHLVARRPGRDGALEVLLIGHLDTVFEPSSDFQDWQDLAGGRVRAPGITDMKGGDVVMLLALEALHTLEVLDALDVTVVLTGDEEKAGSPLSLARAPLLEAARGVDVALGFEDGDGDPSTAVVARRGASGWRLQVRGTPAHSSQIFQPEVGAGAIFEMARILDAFREQLQSIEDLTFNPGLVIAGTDVEHDAQQATGVAFGKDNVVAEFATVSGDLRALSPEDLERARERMREITASSLAGTVAELEFEDGYPPMGLRETNLRLLGIYDQASRDLGFGPVGPVNPRRAGAADISFVASVVPATMDGLGLMGTGGHTVEETADMKTLASQAKRAAVLLYRLSHDWPAGGEEE